MSDLLKYKPGETYAFPGFVYQHRWSSAPSWCHIEMIGPDYTTICKADLVFTVPATFNATAAEVAGIDKALDAAAEAYFGTVRDLKQRKEELLKLTFEAAADASEVVTDPVEQAIRLKAIDDDIPF